MGCFWIGINHTSHGLVKVSPKKRLLLELISGVLLLISWAVIVPGVIQVGTLYWDNVQEMANDINEIRTYNTLDDYNGYESPVHLETATVNVMSEMYAVVAFILGNSVYLLATLFFAIGNLIYRKDIILRKTLLGRSEWREREKHDFCFDICNPLNGLRMFHHLEHRAAFLFNLIAFALTLMTDLSFDPSPETLKLLSTTLGYSITICLLTLCQSFLSYFYAEDVALCGMSCCCVHFWFVRRYPQEQADVALAVSNDENPAKLGKYNQFQNEDDVNPPEYNQVV